MLCLSSMKGVSGHRRGGRELGNQRLEAHGPGAYIARATEAGDYHRIVLGIAVMSLIVVIVNRTFWRRLYGHAERHFRLD